MNDLIGISQSSKFATINQSKRGIIRLKKASSRGDVLRSITIQNEELEDNSNKDKIIHHKSELPSIERNKWSRRSTESKSKLGTMKTNYLINQTTSQKTDKRTPIKMRVTKEMIMRRKRKFLHIANKGVEAFRKIRKIQAKPPLPYK